MKNTYASLAKKLNKAKQVLKSKGQENLQKVEEIRARFSRDIDQYIDRFYKKHNFIKEALERRAQLKKSKIGFFQYLRGIKIRHVVSFPFIMSMIVPAVILHVFLEMYHRICFPLYGIPTLRARDYFIFDRQHLSYLNWLEKVFCVYCSYFNCLIGYTREIAALTELYWCPIKHAKRVKNAHDKYYLFVDYLEGKEYRAKQKILRTMAMRHEDMDGKKCEL